MFAVFVLFILVGKFASKAFEGGDRPPRKEPEDLDDFMLDDADEDDEEEEPEAQELPVEIQEVLRTLPCKIDVRLCRKSRGGCGSRSYLRKLACLNQHCVSHTKCDVLNF